MCSRRRSFGRSWSFLFLSLLALACGKRDPAPSVVFVRAEGTFEEGMEDAGESSGVILDDSGYVLTCYHCLLGQPDFAGRTAGGRVDDPDVDVLPGDLKVEAILQSGTEERRSFRAAVVRTYPRADLAVLKLDASTAGLGVKLAESGEREEKVSAVGYPYGSDAAFGKLGPEVSVRTGAVSALRHNGSRQIVQVEHTAAVDYGMSGGGLFNGKGELLGINVQISETGETAMAVGLDVVRTVLDNALRGQPLDYHLLGIEPNATLAVVTASGGSVRTIVPVPLKNHKAPAWSPDADRIAFETYGDERNEVYLWDLAGGTATKLTRSDLGSHSPDWSPDGKYVAVTAGSAVEVYDLTGKVAFRFRSSRGALGYPSWSPDGKSLCAVLKDRHSGLGELALIDVSAGSVETVDLEEPRNVHHPDWSPDGRRIAFSAVVPGRSDKDLFVYDLDRGTVKRLSWGRSNDLNPAWSPSGRLLAYTSAAIARTTHDVFVIPAGGGTPKRVTREGVNSFGPAWSPAGDRIAFYRMNRPPAP